MADDPARGSSRRALAPEVVQTSPMDCGPAALKCLLEGFRIPVSYGRLREAVQTDVDGTSIDALTGVSRSLGLDAAQLLVPVDHVAHSLARTLPAIAVVRLPTGANHFVVVWRRVGPWVQVMDPAAGRLWLRVEELRRQLYVHAATLPAATWRRFAGAPRALRVLEREIAKLGHRGARALVAEAAHDEGWRSLAALEAAMRMVRSLCARAAIERGGEAARLIESLFQRARSGPPFVTIPPGYWSATPCEQESGGEPALFVRGALLVHVRGKLGLEHADARPLSPELAAAIAEPPAQPLRAILREIPARDRRIAAVFVALTLVGAAAVLVQGLVFQALFAVGARFSLDEQRFGVFAAVLAFSSALFLLEWPLAEVFLRLGRGLDARWRAAFQSKIPLLPERWFASRPSSDMAERAHGLSMLRMLPALGARTVRTFFQLAFTTAGLVWLDPSSWPFALTAALAACTVPFVFQPMLHERELSLRNHHGALGRFYLETLLGLVAVRVHGAERRLRREHESMLVEWLRAGRKVARTSTLARAAVSLTGFATAAVLVVAHLARHPADPTALLFAYWALALPALGDQLAQVALQLPSVRNATLRALEPLTAPREEGRAEVETRDDERETAEVELAPALLKAAGAQAAQAPRSTPRLLRDTDAPRGVAITLRAVELKLGGHPVLDQIDLAIEPGEHVALVGRSGAGKSSLVGLLLGFHGASAGRVLLDGAALDSRTLAELRRSTAWIDPAAQLWNQSLFDNLVYGVGFAGADDLAAAIDDAELSRVLEELPEGLSTRLGEGGGFLSGGEAQRVRLARALLRPNVRLALLDEPFRGVDRSTRRTLLGRARARWRHATLLCATHDLEETLDFDRVVVLEHGRVVAHGRPRELAKQPHGAYAELVSAEREVQALWRSSDWTRWRVEGGGVHVTPAEDRA